jgi:hypothetical protein
MSTRGAHSCVRKHRDGLAALDEQRLVVAEAAELADDRVERVPAARRAARAAVDDEVVGILGDLGIEVVHEHPQRGFLRPAAAAQLGAAGRADGSRPRPRRVLAIADESTSSAISRQPAALDDALAELAGLADGHDETIACWSGR